MEQELDKILEEYDEGNMNLITLKAKLLHLFSVSNSALIDYAENEAEVLIPIEDMFNPDGTHITKNQYGKVVIKHLCNELREHYC
jgi:hypothetical protein